MTVRAHRETVSAMRTQRGGLSRRALRLSVSVMTPMAPAKAQVSRETVNVLRENTQVVPRDILRLGVQTLLEGPPLVVTCFDGETPVMFKTGAGYWRPFSPASR